MKKSWTILCISLFVFACSHKTVPTAANLEGRVMKTSSSTVTNEQYVQGKAVFEANCGRCHKYRDPTKYTTTQWTKWLDKMAPKAKLSDEQKMQVFNFVSVNAKKK